MNNTIITLCIIIVLQFYLNHFIYFSVISALKEGITVMSVLKTK